MAPARSSSTRCDRAGEDRERRGGLGTGFTEMERGDIGGAVRGEAGKGVDAIVLGEARGGAILGDASGDSGRLERKLDVRGEPTGVVTTESGERPMGMGFDDI